jgi:hypothetical protein
VSADEERVDDQLGSGIVHWEHYGRE